MFALARAITQDFGAAVIAALVFAFDPFRFSHYSHLELQFTCWMPLALLALFRTLSVARPRDGLATGIFVSLQALSSLYYCAYLSVSLVVVTIRSSMERVASSPLGTRPSSRPAGSFQQTRRSTHSGSWEPIISCFTRATIGAPSPAWWPPPTPRRAFSSSPRQPGRKGNAVSIDW
jgi:hypothetical protein